MTWTYDPTLATARDKVRLLIGDTDTANQLLSDEEIAFFNSQQPNNVYFAAAMAARAVAAKFSRMVDTRVESVSESASQYSKQYADLAGTLENQGKTLNPNAPDLIITGTSVSEMRQAMELTDRVPEAFHAGQFDNPNSLVPTQQEQ